MVLFQGGAMASQAFKIPQSVLVVIHTPALDVLLIRRAIFRPRSVALTCVARACSSRTA